jgi:hypothetical protein
MTIKIDELKSRAKELLDALPTLDQDELANGLKMFNLSYMDHDVEDRLTCLQAHPLLVVINNTVLHHMFEKGWT